MKLGSKVPLLLLVFLTVSTVYGDSRNDQVDALFGKFDRPDSPGCALGVIENGQFTYKRGYGMANLEYAIPISSETVFRTGSVSKQFTAMSVLLADHAGKLSLDDDVREHIPELADYGHKVTIRHLIHHTSGIRDYLVLMAVAGKRDEDYYTDEEVIEKLARLENLNFPPGDEYLYSNAGYFLLSQVILRATGKTLAEWADEVMFKPLGMENTHFHDDPRMIVENRASGYRPRKDGGFEIDMTSLEMVGDGGVFTSIDDLIKWDRNFDSATLGGESVMQQMLTPGKLNGGIAQDYASGLRVSRYRGLNIVEHGGAFVGFRAGMLRFPDQNFSAYCLCNSSDVDPTELLRQVTDIYLADYFQDDVLKTIELPEDVLQKKVGTFWNERTGGFWDLELADGKLALTRGGRPTELLALSEEDFVIERGLSRVKVRFEGEAPLKMTVQSEGQRPFEYLRVERVELAKNQMPKYEGSYHCRELDATYELQIDGEGNLILKMAPLPDRTLTPVTERVFRYQAGSLVFKISPSDTVDGFRLSVGRARNFEFVKE
jgi:CubicO group peptidase (beta-lactamase class C family)